MTASPETLAIRFSQRSVTTEDEEVLFRIYSSTRAEELAPVPWNDQQKEAFLRMQFDAQTRYYTTEYSGAVFEVIIVEGEVAGRLSVHRRPSEIRIMDIAFLPAFRGRGIGTQLILDLFEEGDREGKTVSIHVECSNRARNLYERLGFSRIRGDGVYDLMERRSSVAAMSQSEVLS